jgi:ribosome modulation factor
MIHEFRGISVCPYVPNRSKQLNGWKDGLVPKGKLLL